MANYSMRSLRQEVLTPHDQATFSQILTVLRCHDLMELLKAKRGGELVHVSRTLSETKSESEIGEDEFKKRQSNKMANFIKDGSFVARDASSVDSKQSDRSSGSSDMYISRSNLPVDDNDDNDDTIGVMKLAVQSEDSLIETDNFQISSTEDTAHSKAPAIMKRLSNRRLVADFKPDTLDANYKYQAPSERQADDDRLQDLQNKYMQSMIKRKSSRRLVKLDSKANLNEGIVISSEAIDLTLDLEDQDSGSKLGVKSTKLVSREPDTGEILGATQPKSPSKASVQRRNDETVVLGKDKNPMHDDSSSTKSSKTKSPDSKKNQQAAGVIKRDDSESTATLGAESIIIPANATLQLASPTKKQLESQNPSVGSTKNNQSEITSRADTTASLGVEESPKKVQNPVNNQNQDGLETKKLFEKQQSYFSHALGNLIDRQVTSSFNENESVDESAYNSAGDSFMLEQSGINLNIQELVPNALKIRNNITRNANHEASVDVFSKFALDPIASSTPNSSSTNTMIDYSLPPSPDRSKLSLPVPPTKDSKDDFFMPPLPPSEDDQPLLNKPSRKASFKEQIGRNPSKIIMPPSIPYTDPQEPSTATESTHVNNGNEEITNPIFAKTESLRKHGAVNVLAGKDNTNTKSADELRKLQGELQEQMSVRLARRQSKPENNQANENESVSSGNSKTSQNSNPPASIQSTTQRNSSRLSRRMDNSKMSGLESEAPQQLYSFKELKTRAANEKATNPYPPNIDSKNRELYLFDAEFEAIFGMSKSDFNSLPKWRRQELKKKNQLF